MRAIGGCSVAGACGGVHGCHSGASDRPHPRDRSPPKPESASSSNALRTGACQCDAAVFIRKLHDGPKPGAAREFQTRRRVNFHRRICATGPLRRSIAAPLETARGPGSRAPGTRSRHPRPSDLHRSLSRPAATSPPTTERSARLCSESWRIPAAATSCAEEQPAASRRRNGKNELNRTAGAPADAPWPAAIPRQPSCDIAEHTAENSASL